MYYKIARQFEREHPEVRVNLIVRNDSDYKSALIHWLTAEKGPSVLYWQAGERLHRFSRQGLIEPINDVWTQEGWDNAFTPSVRDAVSLDGNIYGLPFSYYQWGFYYKKSLFDKLGLPAPRNWDEFLLVCETLKSEGIPAIAIGTKNHWPAAAWFDYLNLRINGLGFHQRLLDGGIPYTDARVREVFEVWKNLVDRGFFADYPDRKDWKQGLPFLYRDKVGMILIGNFVEQHLPSVLAEDIEFFRFPRIKEDLPFYEEAPTEVLMLPKNAANKPAARKFLAYMGRPEIQAMLNDGLGYISPNVLSAAAASHLARAGAEVLENAAGISQYYDRDTLDEMASQGVVIFASFLKSGDVDLTLEELEALRKRVYQPR